MGDVLIGEIKKLFVRMVWICAAVNKEPSSIDFSI